MRTLLALFLASLPAVAADPPKPPLVAPVDINDWTPRPAGGKAEPFERMKDPDWDDKRFQATDTGPMLNCTFRYPFGTGQQMAYKATVIKLAGGKAAVAFDRNSLKTVAGWTGGFVNISDKRFGLMNTPTPKGSVTFALPAIPGWADANGKWDAGTPRLTAPLPKDWAKYRGLYLHGDRVVVKYTVGDLEVLESPKLVTYDGLSAIVRSINVRDPQGGVNKRLMLVDKLAKQGQPYKAGVQTLHAEAGTDHEAVALADKPANVALLPDASGYVFLQNAGSVGGFKADLAYGRFPAAQAETFTKLVGTLGGGEDLTPLTKPAGPRWGKPLVTKLVRGSTDGPFAIDTLTIPYDNPYKALFFSTAVDFLPDGRVVMTTAHGDVWLVRIDEAKDECHWQRFATGLYQPMGVKVIDGKIVVLERGQLTRLHDENADGEADFYECVNNDWHCSGGEHSYDTSLETDPQGNFYFHKTGDTDTPTGGTLMRISKDGRKADIYCTGFRHPIGLGISPTGIITGADQEGNWMPATRIDEYKPGGFYGDMRASHRDVPPKTYDPPVCWLPREIDNSAGGQVWVPTGDRWGPLAGLPLHFSYGRCKAFVLLRQEVGDTLQGGAADLGMRFLSGSRTGRFQPTTGDLYVVGLNGWQTAAKADGSLQRVRPTGKPFDVPVKMEVVPAGVKLTFPNALDPAAVKNPANFRAAWWDYRWTANYGSKRWKVSDPQVEGQDDVPIAGAELSADGKTVFVKVTGGIKPVMQMQLGYNLTSKDATRAVTGSVFLTVHDVGKK